MRLRCLVELWTAEGNWVKVYGWVAGGRKKACAWRNLKLASSALCFQIVYDEKAPVGIVEKPKETPAAAQEEEEDDDLDIDAI